MICEGARACFRGHTIYVFLVERGEVAYQGTAKEAREDPALVRAFLGDAALSD